jgi:DNA-binding MarR family transcriptional regulator
MDKTALFQKVINLTTSMHQVTHELTKEVKSKAFSVTPVQYRIMEFIAVGQPVTLSEICDCLDLSMPNASRELRKLKEKDLCEKVVAVDDKRKHIIRLSEKGQNMMNAAFQGIEARFLERIQHVSEEDLAQIDFALDVLQSKVFYPAKPPQ